MKAQQQILFYILILLLSSIAHAVEASGVQLSVQKLLNPRGELIIQKNLISDLLVGTKICSGEEVQTLPVLGECPKIVGYYSIKSTGVRPYNSHFLLT